MENIHEWLDVISMNELKLNLKATDKISAIKVDKLDTEIRKTKSIINKCGKTPKPERCREEFIKKLKKLEAAKNKVILKNRLS